MPINLKNYVPPEVRLDQARHKARKAYGRHKIVSTPSKAFTDGWERIWGKKNGKKEE